MLETRAYPILIIDPTFISRRFLIHAMIDTGKSGTWKAKVVYEATPEWESTIYGRRRHSLAGRDQPCTWT